MRAQLPRWCFASIADHFATLKTSNFKMYVEGDHRDTNTVPEWFELRIDGPYFREVSRNYWYVDVEINTLVETTLNENDAYRYLKNIGKVMPAFTDVIKVFRFGNEATDDDSFVGCLMLKQEFREKIVVSHFGLTSPDTKVRQSQIEAHYRMELEQVI